MFNVLLSCYKLAKLRGFHPSTVMASEDPWGERDKGGKPKQDNEQPPDLDEFFANLKKKITGDNRSGGKGGGSPTPNIGFSKKTIGLLTGVALAVWLSTGVYTVQERENGVEMVLGKHTNTTTSGLNWNWPAPIGHVEKVDVQSIATMRIGEFRTQKSSVSTSSQRVGQMLTSDENIVEIGAAVQYRISSAENYLFVANEPEKVLEDIVISAIREVVGASTVDEVLRDRRNEWPQEAKSIITTILRDFGLGFEIVAFELQDARAPAEVQDAFEDAVRAREDEERLRLKAEAYALERLPVARGQAEQHVQDAMAYEARVLAQANANVSRFNDLYKVYLMDKMAMRDRLYLDTMSEVYGNSQTVVVDAKNTKPIVNLGEGSYGHQGRDLVLTASALEAMQAQAHEQNERQDMQRDRTVHPQTLEGVERDASTPISNRERSELRSRTR